MRNELRSRVYDSCRSASPDHLIWACDSPVGSGKTTAIMAYLLQAATALNLRHIFVVLPYTNIVRQSTETYRQALTLPGENPACEYADSSVAIYVGTDEVTRSTVEVHGATLLHYVSATGGCALARGKDSNLQALGQVAKGEDGETKTDVSDGYVPLHPVLARHLRAWQRQTPDANETDFVFPSMRARGRKPLSSSVFVADHLRPAAGKAGVHIEDGQRFGLRNLRHSLSNWLVNKAKVEPKTVGNLAACQDSNHARSIYARRQRRNACRAGRVPDSRGYEYDG
jgi:hypothetical protein